MQKAGTCVLISVYVFANSSGFWVPISDQAWILEKLQMMEVFIFSFHWHPALLLFYFALPHILHLVISAISVEARPAKSISRQYVGTLC